ncbi:hypothetical protein ACWD7F_05170 [Streptomyces sp. NPDC005122]
MSENSATRVLEDGQNRAFEDGRVPAPHPRPPLAAMTAAGDGDFTEAPETGHGPFAEPSAAFPRIAGGDLTQWASPYNGNRQFRYGMRGLAHVVNRAADQLALSTGEVTPVAHQAGAAGRLYGRTKVRGL